MNDGTLAVHGYASLGLGGVSTSLGRWRASVIADALRSGLYDVLDELRLIDDGSPRMMDLMPRKSEDGGKGSAQGFELPMIRLRSLTPVNQDLDALGAAAHVYDAVQSRDMDSRMRNIHTGLDAAQDHSERLALLNDTMIAALTATITPEMRELARDRRHVCGITSPMPWAPACAAVMKQSSKRGFVAVASMPVDQSISDLLAPTCSITQPGKTIDKTMIHTIEAAFAFRQVNDLPSTVDAMRTLAKTTIEEQLR